MSTLPRRAALLLLSALLLPPAVTGCDHSTNGTAVDAALPVDASVPDLSSALDQARPDDAAPEDLAAADLARSDLAPRADGAAAAEGDPCGPSANGLACARGLVCCYPCGQPMCTFRCQTPCAPSPSCPNGCPLVP